MIALTKERRLMVLLDTMASHVQGIRIREVQAMAEAGDWDGYKDKSNADWSGFNRAHEEAVRLIDEVF